MKNKKGITLIALIITIIVLLILAGVSISLLTGENGVLEQAQEAVKKSNLETVKEELSMAWASCEIEYMASSTSNVTRAMYFTAEKMNEYLRGKGTVNDFSYGTAGANGETQIEYTKTATEKYKFIINKTGEMASVNKVLVADIKANPKKYYGKQVLNYNASGEETTVYRLFYVNTEEKFGDPANTVYLKVDYGDYLNGVGLSVEYKSDTKVKELNPKWKVQRENSTWNNNEKVAAYLCSPVYKTGGNIKNTDLPWSRFYKDDENVNYVVGGPSVEMYVKSYSQTHDGNFKTGSTTERNEALGADYRETAYPGYIYLLNGGKSTVSNNDYYTGADTIDVTTKYKNMYCGRNGNKIINGTSLDNFWWIASPSSYHPDEMCCINCRDADFGFGEYRWNVLGLSPLVALNSNIQELEIVFDN